jgi:hypothetical protein
MVRHLGILAVLAIFLGGCASYPDTNRERLQSLPQRYTQFDVDMAWEVRSVDSQTVVDGVLKNDRYAVMSDIEVWVSVFDASGKLKARSVSFIVPRELRRDEIAPFSLKLPVRAVPGTKIRFTYKYIGSDGGTPVGGSGGAEQWMQSFDVEVPRQ